MTTKKDTQLTVKHTKSSGGIPCWGITDGKKWFFYGYATPEQAEKVKATFATPMSVRVNVSVPAPGQVIPL